MNTTLSRAIFGVGIILALAALISIYVTSIAQQDQKIQGTTAPTTVAQPSEANTSTATVTNQSSATASSNVSSIAIAEGSAAQQVKVYYQPNPAAIPGDSKVTWTNNDIAPHTATASDFSFDTGVIPVGSSGSAKVKGQGNISYRCTIHPWMTGLIRITGSSQTQAIGSSQSQITGSSQTNPGGSSGIIASTNSSQQAANNTVPSVNDTSLKVEQVISGLSMPTTMAFIGPDDFLLLQKGGTVFRVTNGTMSTNPLLNRSVGTGFTQGMLGVAISNNSRSNTTYVFLYFTEPVSNQIDGVQNQTNASEPLVNRVYRYELSNGDLVNPKLLLQLPAKEGYMDNGGYLKIGPDGNLYLTVGAITASNVSDVQTLTQNFVNGTAVDGRAGILRITQDGGPVLNEQGHGLLGDNHPINLYYGYGLKDSFGIDFDPITGNLWDAEPGRIINDEINLVKPGFNGGFEAVQGPSIYVPAAAADLVYFNGTGKYRDPEFIWTQKVVPVGLIFLTSNKLGEKYENDIFLGSFLNGKIYHFDLNEDRDHLIVPDTFIYNQMANWNSTGAQDITFGEGFGGISSLNVGPDGYLYVISFINGAIYKIMPAQ